jgi:hypothetical protein
MNCAEVRRLLPDHLKGTPLPGAAEAHLAECPACRREFQELGALWGALGVLPLPASRPGFRLRKPRRLAWAGWAAAACLMGVLGLGIGRWSRGPRLEGPALEAWTAQEQSRAALQFVNSPSASERLQGLAMLNGRRGELAGPLLALVEKDPDTSVRLAAVEALYLFGGSPSLRPKLGAALARQDRPQVQLALADLIVSLRERQALEALRRLAQDGRLDAEARSHVATGLAQLEGTPL